MACNLSSMETSCFIFALSRRFCVTHICIYTCIAGFAKCNRAKPLNKRQRFKLSASENSNTPLTYDNVLLIFLEFRETLSGQFYTCAVGSDLPLKSN